MLQSMSNGVITFDEDDLGRSCNGAGGRIIRKQSEAVVGLGPAAVSYTHLTLPTILLV